ncbi:MAG: MarR family winged helix-turn-helix transcriptional regulator [Rubrivivax sp.]
MIDLKRQASLREAIELFYFGYRAFTAHPDAILRRRGLSRVHHRILYFVGREPGLGIQALLETLGVSKQALNAPLRRLVELKLVAVCAAQDDGRRRELRLTAEGERLEAQLTGTQMEQLAAVLGATGRTAEAGWRAVMTRLQGKD